MKPVKQKQQEALERRKTNLAAYTAMKITDRFPPEWPWPKSEDEATQILNRKIEVCQRDIDRLQDILENTY